MRDDPVLELKNISKAYKGFALSDVGFSVAKGEQVAVIGRSGCGKTTLARIILGLEKPDCGEIYLRGENITHERKAGSIQAIFQNPFSSLNPKWKIKDILIEPLLFSQQDKSAQAEACGYQKFPQFPLNKGKSRRLWGQGVVPVAATFRLRKSKFLCEELLDRLLLPETALEKYPGELSGGERQRIAIGRAVISSPSLLIADEPTSSLDASAERGILDLISALCAETGAALLLITHNIIAAGYIAKRCLVMSEGAVAEDAPMENILSSPVSAAARALIFL